MSRHSAEALAEALGRGDPGRICDALHTAKTQIKREAIETSAVDGFFDAIRRGLKSDHGQVVVQTLGLTHGTIRRLNIQDAAIAREKVPAILTELLESGRIADTDIASGGGRAAALLSDCINAANQSCSGEVERALKHAVASGQPTSSRLTAVGVIGKLLIDRSSGPFHRWLLATLLRSLEDANEQIRSASRKALIAARDGDRPIGTEVTTELRRIGLRPATRHELSLIFPLGTEHDAAHPADVKRHQLGSSQHDGSVAGSVASTYLGSIPGSEMESVDSKDVQSGKDLELELATMVPFFDGRESEKNWIARERSVQALRGYLRGNAVRDHLTILLSSLRSLLDGLVKGMSSLRTSLCLNSLQLVKDMAIVLGPAVNPLAEQLFPAMVKLTALTKKIAAAAANVSICVVLAHCSCWNRFIPHIALAATDKNVAPRLYAASWLRFVLEAQVEQHSLDHQSIDTAEKSLRRMLGDANPGVREAARTTFWQFATLMPDRADSIVSSLEPSARRQLDRAHGRPEAQARGPALASQAEKARSEAGSDGRGATATAAAAAASKSSVVQAPASTLASQSGLGSGASAESQHKSSGLNSGSIRTGLGAARRPAQYAPALHTQNNGQGRVSAPASAAATLSTQPATVNASPIRTELERPSPRRKRTIVEQLEHEDWRQRAEGVVILACLLAKREPPQQVDGSKYALPPTEILLTVLRKLVADPQAEVFNHLMAPEVVAEVAKIVTWDSILPRVLLLAESDETEHGHDVKSNCLPSIKERFPDEAAIHHCLNILALLKVTGHAGKTPRSIVKFSPTQKRLIIRGVLHWLIELCERHSQSLAAGSAANATLADPNEYRMLMNRTTSMITNIQPTSINYVPLATFLRLLRAVDPGTFDKNLDTFERPIVSALRRAWGEQCAEEEHALCDEPVAGVEQVLGLDPAGLATEHASEVATAVAVHEDPRTSDSDGSETDSLGIDDAAMDLTVVNLPRFDAPPKTPAAVRRAMAEVDSPFSPIKNGTSPRLGKENQTSPTAARNPVLEDAHAQLQGMVAPSTSAATGISRAVKAGLWEQAALEGASNHAERGDIGDNGDAIIDGPSAFWHDFFSRTKQDPAAAMSDCQLWLKRDRPTAVAASRMLLLLENIAASDAGQCFSDQLVQASARLCFATAEHARTIRRPLSTFLCAVCDRIAPATAITLVLQAIPERWLTDPNMRWSGELTALLICMSGLVRSVTRLAESAMAVFRGAIATIVRKGLGEEFDGDAVLVAEIRRMSVNLALAIHRAVGRNSGKVFAVLESLQPAQVSESIRSASIHD